MSLKPEELDRYARHIILHEIGGAGQQRLSRARVLIVGAGGLGSAAILYLAAAGAGYLTVVDDDEVSLSNLQRQVIHDTGSVGTSKVISAASAVSRVNPNISFTGVNERLTDKNADEIIASHDLVLDGCDNFATRYLVNSSCVAQNRPLISAAMSQWDGQISLYDPARGGPCYECIFPQAPAAGLAPTCAEVGVIGALPGVMGSMMALEAIKHITGAGTGLRGALLIYDGLYSEMRRIKTMADPECSACGGISRQDV